MARRVATGLDRRLHDVGGGRKVRLSGPEADDGLTGGFERLRLRVDRERGGFGDGRDAA